MTDCARMVAMDAFLAQWCWGQLCNDFVKDTSGAKFFKIMEKICEAVKCSASDVMINWQRAMRTPRNNGFDQNVARGIMKIVNVMIKLVKGNARSE